ncbi:MAG: ABC transporter ATP-binding protein [Saccharospirillaceae bacterium]|nr:ABC transporter ATP-binding protein [Pseudomonadales bacterium]NRB79247.1 ABC transporter ATP-binding protein [Saccharospirillaceae bacterium]
MKSDFNLDSQSNNQIVIQTRNLCKTFGEKDTLVKALDDVSLDIKAGEFSAIIGPSGSGKSTLLQMIGGLDVADSGEIILAGNNIADLSSGALTRFRRDHIGFIFQSYNLIPVLSAAENVEYIMLLQGIEKVERKERTFEILKQVGLLGRENRRPGQLSGGQQQRVAVARAMVSKPDIILADEPTANLDSKTGIELLDMMKELNEVHKMTFLFSTHDPKIMDRATRLIQLVDGKLTD